MSAAREARARVAPPWLEGRVGFEQMALLADPIFRGAGVPRGNGRQVLLIPGFLAGDWSLTLLATWLRRVGYRPRRSGIMVNAATSSSTVRALERRLLVASGPGATPVTIIGHSRGGVLGKVLAQRNPHLVDQLITLGSPLSEPLAVSTGTRLAIRALRFYAGVRYGYSYPEHPDFLRDLAAESVVPTTSIYTTSDGVVDWHACTRDDVRGVEVGGSHVGLATNRAVYRELARLLVPLEATVPA